MKAILVLNKMPKCCAECEVVDYWSRPQEYHCRYLEDRYMKKYNEKPIDCPLKSIPQKIDICERIYQAYGLGNDEIYQRIRQEVEDIYDEILGEEE